MMCTECGFSNIGENKKAYLCLKCGYLWRKKHGKHKRKTKIS